MYRLINGCQTVVLRIATNRIRKALRINDLRFLEIFRKLSQMPEISTKELEKIANSLRLALAIVEEKLHPEIDVPLEVLQEVERKLAEGICLAWDHQIEAGSRVIRGLCQADYATTMARIRRGEENERQLILEGKLLAEGKKGGRKAARDVAAEQAAKALKIAEMAERYNNRKKNKGEK